MKVLSKDLKMRLALVAANAQENGSTALPYLLAEHWAERGWPVTFLSLQKGPREPSLPAPIQHQTLSDGPGAPGPGLMLRLRKSVKERHPQVVISFGDISNMLCLGALAGSDIPVIATECANPLCSPVEQIYGSYRRQALCRLRKWLYRLAHNIVLQTDDALEYFPPPVRRKALAIPEPVLPCTPEPTPLALPKPCIVALGDLEKRERFDLLIEAFASTANRHKSWCLAIGGSGPELEALKSKSKSLGLEGRVFFPGEIENRRSVISQAQIFALTSSYQHFPRALCDAMACGLAVVAFDYDYGPRGIIRDNLDGILLPPDDGAALGTALDQLMRFPHIRQALGTQARNITQRFSLEGVLARWDQLLSTI